MSTTVLSFDRLPHAEKWLLYRDTRQGTYEFRSRTRYAEVERQLWSLGLKAGDPILDIGAGEQQFERHMRDRGWFGRYIPVDAVIDGVDLETWTPAGKVPFIVSIEVVEHLFDPNRLLSVIERACTRGAVITTPNPDVVDVIACDPTHVSEVSISDLHSRGWNAYAASLFGKEGDSIVGVFER